MTIVLIHETDSQEGHDYVSQCSFTQKLFNEDYVLEDVIPIEQPTQVNVINLLSDYTNSPPKTRHHVSL
jgi:hypothetical protein